MKTLYLIRHALPRFPGGRRMCLGTTDVPLGEEGLRQAEEMAAQLPPVTAVFTSPLSRAVQTAQAIGRPVILEGLREKGMGDWDGLTFGEIRARWPELYAARAWDRSLLPPGAEDPAAALARFEKAMELAARSAPGDLAVVAHGGVIAEFTKSLGLSGEKPGYCQILPLRWDGERFTIQEE